MPKILSSEPLTNFISTEMFPNVSGVTLNDIVANLGCFSGSDMVDQS